MESSGVITLLTDFGLADGYVASMKGVLLRFAPRVVQVDITHLVAPHDVVGGAFVLASAAPYFPPGTLHLAVVDPGVGTSRSAVAVRTKDAWYVGPDNGLLWRAAGEQIEEVFEIETVPELELPRSRTFHGRDLFAPAAAYLALGNDPARLGSRQQSLTPLDLPKARVEGDLISGEVIHIDHFGNVITNIEAKQIPAPPAELTIEVAGRKIEGLIGCYGDAPAETLCALIGSDDLLEIAVSEGSAEELLEISRSALVTCQVAV